MGTLLMFPEKIAYAKQVLDTSLLSPEGKLLWDIFKNAEEGITKSVLVSRTVEIPGTEGYVKNIIDLAEASGEWLKPLICEFNRKTQSTKMARFLIQQGERLNEGEEIDPFTIISQLKRYTNLIQEPASLESLIDNELASIQAEIGRPPELPTGLRGFDKLTGGLHRGEVLVIGGAPSSGKTSFALTIAMNLLKKGKRVLINSLEMTKEHILRRFLTLNSGISVFPPYVYELTSSEMAYIHEQAKNMVGWKALILNRIKDLHTLYVEATQFKPDLLVIDYLQLYPTPKGASGRVEGLGILVKQIQDIAQDLNISVLLLSQLRRGASTATETPTLDALRDSGEIEQDADSVGLLYRKWLYDKSAVEDRVDFFLAKQRNGRTGRLELKFYGKGMLFQDASENEGGVK